MLTGHPPNSPSRVRATLAGKQVNITWDPPSQTGGATSLTYSVFGGAEGDGGLAGTTNTTWFVIGSPALSAGQQYQFTVRAEGSTGMSPLSNPSPYITFGGASDSHAYVFIYIISLLE